MSDIPATCPYCGDGMESIGTLNHIECVAALEAERDELETMLRRKHVRWDLLMAERAIAEMSGGRDDD